MRTVPDLPITVEPGRSVIAPVVIDGLPERIDALGEPWLRKVEFHVTTVSAATLERAAGSDPDLWSSVAAVADGRSIGPVLVFEDVRRVTDPERPGLRTLIAMVHAAGLDALHHDLAAALGSPLGPPPAHITLYSSDPEAGIGIDDEWELVVRAPPLPLSAQQEVRAAMRF
ncbi:MAG TPA: hypothetical protein VGI87_10295 [Solirubrobacteraceae bacterium]|jgi:hypothetical protein